MIILTYTTPLTESSKRNLLGMPDTSFRGLSTLIALNVLKSTSMSWGTMNVINLEKWEDIYRHSTLRESQMQATEETMHPFRYTTGNYAENSD